MSIAEASAASLPLFSNDRMAGYLVEGFWADFDDRPRRFNLAETGPGAKAGALQYYMESVSPEAQVMIEAALALYGEALGVTIERVDRQSTKVDLRFSDTGDGAATQAYMSDEGMVGYAAVNVEAAWLDANGDALGDYSFLTYLHEIAHAFGLGHAGRYDGRAVFVAETADPDYGVNSNVALNDSWQMTIMSYLDQDMNPTVAADFAIPISPMVADWIAFERLYGPTRAYSGDTVWGIGTNIATGPFARLAELADANAFTLIDAGGQDLLDLSSFSSDQTVDLRSERYSDVGGLVGNMGIARGTVIEDFRSGSGNDRITGNGADNRIMGGSGSDWIWGGGRNDRLEGGAGKDRLHGDAGSDMLIGGAGSDRLAGGADGDVLIGGAGADVFVFALETRLRADRIVSEGTGPAFDAPGRVWGDRIELSGIDADPGRAGDQAFVFGRAGAGCVWLENSGAETLVQARLSGATQLCLRVLIEDGDTVAADYRAADFIL